MKENRHFIGRVQNNTFFIFIYSRVTLLSTFMARHSITMVSCHWDSVETSLWSWSTMLYIEWNRKQTSASWSHSGINTCLGVLVPTRGRHWCPTRHHKGLLSKAACLSRQSSAVGEATCEDSLFHTYCFVFHYLIIWFPLHLFLLFR